jgi:hypothetical protein
MTKELKKVGFWWSSTFGHLAEYAQLPIAQQSVDPDWDPKERAATIKYLKDGDTIEQYRGMSTCRFCGCFNGSEDVSDGTYVWPSGFAHYLEKHQVKPPKEFLEHVRSKR